MNHRLSCTRSRPRIRVILYLIRNCSRLAPLELHDDLLHRVACRHTDVTKTYSHAEFFQALTVRSQRDNLETFGGH